MPTAKAFSASNATSPLAAASIPRREVGPTDVAFEIQYCGVCHSDLHTARNEWAAWPTVYPCVPGHEIVGKVTAVGAKVSKYKIGDRVAVGCMVDSCGACAGCREGLEQYCDAGKTVFTYNSADPHGTAPVTYGGYSDRIVVDEKFVLRVPENLDLAGVAPLLCAGITLYSPLKHWGAGPGKKVGIVGLGGLGHMGVKFAHAFGAETVLFTTSPSKVADGKRLGADQVVVSKDADQMKQHERSFDLIVNTVAVSHNLDPFLSLLKRDGTLVLVGAPEHPHPSPAVFQLLFARRSLAGSGIGGIPETQEMLDYCSEKGIVSDIELIPIQQINEAYTRMAKGDVKYRFVIDMKTLNS
ncbi:NAD(P)-dependent alcohol dehydrogenase [Limnoglobus roseus]|uniref:NAD(P)-dependent alcohol dehydrogenase n=1 Tax=Limnoglobus roseus TaxID=2598579 RepID=A0A5C1AHA4_9BACT|nr:NAD(P)-dependent alcohol dehydrogenase [Limnoglobus roseus]QEL16494.1 NAD(P)-dependent alcohol dehydrogenase [Limnoglobus roseus]